MLFVYVHLKFCVSKLNMCSSHVFPCTIFYWRKFPLLQHLATSFNMICLFDIWIFHPNAPSYHVGREATIFYRRFADLLSCRNTLTYSNTTVCICGSRSISYHSANALWRWAWLQALRTCKLSAFVQQLCYLCWGGGKGIMSSPGKKF